MKTTCSLRQVRLLICHLPRAAVTSLYGSRDLPKASPRTNQCYVGFLLQLWAEPRVILQAHFYIMVKEKAIEMFKMDMSIFFLISWSHNTNSLVASARIGVIFAASSTTEKLKLPPVALCACKTSELFSSSVTSSEKVGGIRAEFAYLRRTSGRAAQLRKISNSIR